MGLRLVKKSITLAMRSRRRFIIFTLMYTVLMAWNAWNIQNFIDSNGDLPFLLISIGATVILSALYAFIVINYRKQEIATLKCIGYTNGNIRTIIIGELVWVSMVAFIIVGEFLIHATAISNFIAKMEFDIGNIDATTYVSNTAPILGLGSIGITLGLFLISQILGILAMYWKILKLRPIVALRVIK
ncbi:MAG: FtsX-like permease family protein [Promethearchaeota archaeon]